MISKIISRAACLAELTSNPKSFSNCPDLHGGSANFKAKRLEILVVKRDQLVTPVQNQSGDY